MESPDSMPTAADYAREDARSARLVAEGNAAKRLELEKQVAILRGQVGFLGGFVYDLLNRAEVWISVEDQKLLEQIKKQSKE